MQKAFKMIKDIKGATAMEYALIATSIAMFIIVSMLFLSRNLNQNFNHVANIL